MRTVGCPGNLENGSLLKKRAASIQQFLFALADGHGPRHGHGNGRQQPPETERQDGSSADKKTQGVEGQMTGRARLAQEEQEHERAKRRE